MQLIRTVILGRSHTSRIHPREKHIFGFIGRLHLLVGVGRKNGSAASLTSDHLLRCSLLVTPTTTDKISPDTTRSIMAQPPPAKKVSDRVHLGFAALAANEKKMAAIRKNAEDSKYFDGSAPKTSKCLTFFLYILRDISYYSAIRCRCSAPRKYFR